MKFTKTIAAVTISASFFILAACGNNEGSKSEENGSATEESKATAEVHGNEIKPGDVTLPIL